MNRVAAIVACCAPLGWSASAQERPGVIVELRTSGNNASAYVSVRGLLSEERFIRAMRSGFPLYLEYRVELMQMRSRWFDRNVTETTWEYVVHHDPVRETFVVEAPEGREDLKSEAGLRQRLERVYVVRLSPDRSGTFYYSASVTARTLSDSDVDEAFDWLGGEEDTSSIKRPGIITRTARRLLVQVAPLPRFSRSEKSERFTWP